MSAITTHVLDTSKGKPGVGIAIALEIQEDGHFKQIGHGVTNSDGRLTTLLPDDYKFEAGNYQLVFDTQAYYEAQNLKCFYPSVSVTFEVVDPSQHFHVPLLLNPYGYSTYRGT